MVHIGVLFISLDCSLVPRHCVCWQESDRQMRVDSTDSLHHRCGAVQLQEWSAENGTTPQIGTAIEREYRGQAPHRVPAEIERGPLTRPPLFLYHQANMLQCVLNKSVETWEVGPVPSTIPMSFVIMSKDRIASFVEMSNQKILVAQPKTVFPKTMHQKYNTFRIFNFPSMSIDLNISFVREIWLLLCGEGGRSIVAEEVVAHGQGGNNTKGDFSRS
eukprot:Lithocolla_globosa_v1_NODE_5898_length_1168_cov_76.185085.p2 type:complete len:217 gc:universal NODE_5898_length_1168_cov_76.185085:720-70(-)